MPRKQSAPATTLPPGTEALLSVTCKDVVLGRGSGTQNHCGNVTYRKLVYLNKELYATSSKFDKLKISKAIVAAVREFGGNFVQADESRGGLYFDIGDKRAWDKTSQALREGQAEIRQQLAEADPAGMSKIAEYNQVISEQTFFAYACKMLESLYHPNDIVGGFSACGQLCPLAKRRATLNQLGVDPMRIHEAMQSLTPQTLPPSGTQLTQPQNVQSFVEHDCNAGLNSVGAVTAITSTTQMQSPMQLFQEIDPLPFGEGTVGGIEPLPYAHGPVNTSMKPEENSDSLPPMEISSNSNTMAATNPNHHLDSLGNMPFQNQSQSDQKPRHARVSGASNGSVFSLRQFCSSDLEMTTEEGKLLMEQLSTEVDDLIRRNSYALLQIDTGRSFEDLVFEDDSVMLSVPKPREILVSNKRESSSSSSSSSRRTFSGVSVASSVGRGSGFNSRLSSRSDMSLISLMNMSILTLDERGEGESHGHMEVPSPQGEKATPKSIIKHSDLHATITHKKAKTRVSFATDMNVSLMSLDDRSFRNLVESICDPEECTDEEKVTCVKHQVSRKMGYPIGRNAVAQKYDGVSAEVGQTAEQFKVQHFS